MMLNNATIKGLMSAILPVERLVISVMVSGLSGGANTKA